MTNSFVYWWYDHLNEKHYIGSHKPKPNDNYISSSTEMLKSYDDHPYAFVRMIVDEDPDYEKMWGLETAILQDVNARSNPEFYNKHNNDNRLPPWPKGKPKSLKWITQQKLRMLGNTNTKGKHWKREPPKPETIAKMKATKKANPQVASNKGLKCPGYQWGKTKGSIPWNKGLGLKYGEKR